MLQWMGGSRQKLKAHQFFEQRRQEEKERTLCQKSATNVPDTHQEKRSLDILGLENLSALPCVHESQTAVADADQVEECRRPGPSHTTDERKARLSHTEALNTANGSAQIQLDNPNPESAIQVLDNNNPDAGSASSDYEDAAGIEKTPETSRSAAFVDDVLGDSGLQPDFKVLDVIKDIKGEVSTQRSATEIYAAFTLEGCGRADVHTPETPLSRRSNKRADPHFASNNYPTVRTSCLQFLDNNLSSIAENANEHGFCRSKQHMITVGIQEEPEPDLLNNSSPTSMDDMVSPLLGCVGGENTNLMWNPAFGPDRNPWNFPEFQSFRDVSCPELEGKETTPPIIECCSLKSTFLTLEPLKEQVFDYNRTDLWSSPVIRPTGWKEVSGDFLVSPFQDEDIQLDCVVTNYRSKIHPDGTPKNICVFQVDDEKPSYLSSPASTMQVFYPEESKHSTSSDRTDFDKITFGMEDILGEWSSKLDLQALSDFSHLDDRIQKSSTISPSETHPHPISQSPFDDMEIKYKGISSETSSTIETEDISNSEQDLKLLSIEEDSDSSTEAFCMTEDASPKKRKSFETFTTSTWDSLPSIPGVGSIEIPFSPTSHPLHVPDNYVKIPSVPDSNHSPTRWNSYLMSDSYQSTHHSENTLPGDNTLNMHEYGQGDHAKKTTVTVESAGTTPSESKRNFQTLINDQKSDFSMFFQDIRESGLPTTETLIVYFPATNSGTEKRSSRNSEILGAKEEETGTDSRFEIGELDNMKHRSVSPNFSACAFNGQGSPLIRRCSGESLHCLDDIENSPGEPVETRMRVSNDNVGESSIQTDQLLDMYSTKIENDDEKAPTDDFLADKMEIDVLAEELHEIELKLLSSTTVAMVVDVVCDDKKLSPLNQQEPSEDAGETWNGGVDVSEQNLNITKGSDGKVHVDDLLADKMKIDVLTQKLHDFELELLKTTSLALEMNTAYDYQELSPLKQQHESEFEKSEKSLPTSKRSFEFCERPMTDEMQHHLDRSSNGLHVSTFEYEIHDRLLEDFQLRQEWSDEQSYKGSDEKRQKTPNGNQKRERENDPETKTISDTKDDKCAFQVTNQNELRDSIIGRDKKRSRSDHHLEGGYKQDSSVNDEHNDGTQIEEKSHGSIKDEGREESRSISDHQQEMNLKSLASDQLKEERQGFNWSSEMLHHQAVSSKSSHDNTGYSNANLGQQQESYGSNIEKGREESFKTTSNLKKSENCSEISSGLLKCHSSNKDGGYEENRSRTDHHYREENQKSSSSKKLGEGNVDFTPREMQHSQATSLTSSNKCSENKTPCFNQQQDFRLSRCKKRIVNASQQQPSNDSSSEKTYDGRTRTQHHNPDGHEESSTINRHKVEFQISTQDNEKGYCTGPSRDISDNNNENERASRNQQQRGQGSNAAERREGNHGGYDSHDQRVPQRTPTRDMEMGDFQGGSQCKEKGHERDLHANYDEEKGASRSCSRQKISCSNKEVTNEAKFEETNHHHQVTSLRTFSATQRQLEISVEYNVKDDKDLYIPSTERSRQCSHQTNQTRRLRLKHSKPERTHHPQYKPALSDRSSHPSAHIHINSDHGLVEGGGEKSSKSVGDVKENVERSSQTSKMQTDTQISDSGSHLSLKPPVQSSKSIPGDRSFEEVRGSQSDYETRDPARHTSSTRTEDKSRSPPLPTDGLLPDKQTPQAMQGSRKAENLEVWLNRGDPGGKCDTDASKCSQLQQMGDPTKLTTGRGQSQQGAEMQYVTMLESFVMQLKFENKILQDTLLEQAKIREGRDGQKHL